MAGKAPQQPQLKKVTLSKPHEHAGIKYRAGDVIEVDATTAQWLEQNGVTGADTTAKTREDNS